MRILKICASLVFSMWTDERGKGSLSFKRYMMYNRLKAVLKVENGLHVSALSISHSEPLIQYLSPAATITPANYPEQNTLALTFPDNQFDLVVSDQVLEHVEGNPAQAVAEMLRVAKPGGLCVLTTCFINPVHGAPSDYWRFTVDGLELLVRTASPTSKICEKGQWGNYYLHFLYGLGLYDRAVRESNNPMTRLAKYNQRNWPVSTWIAFYKP